MFMNVLLGILSEVILSVGIIFIILLDIFLNDSNSKKFISRVSLSVLLLSILSVVCNINYYLKEQFFLNSNIILDNVSVVFKLLFLFGGIVTIFISKSKNFLNNKKTGEFYTLLLGAILGASLIVSSNNIILFYLSFEMLSISSYVLAGLNDTKKSKEGALKYALFGSVSSSLMILGFSYLYGLSGTIDISQMTYIISDMLTLETNVISIIISLLLVFVGIGYKISLFPFHFWVPDVYEGAPTCVSGFLSVVSKAAGFSFLLRVLLIPVGLWYEYFWNGVSVNSFQIILGLLAVCSVCYGNFVAIKQDNLKRLMGYSSIAHAGYMALALSSGNKLAIKAVIFYLLVYLFMNFLVFAFINFVENIKDKKDIYLADIRGLGKKFSLIGVCVFIAIISLAGLPPTGGFSGKFLLFDSLIERALSFKDFGFASYYFLSLALIGVLNSVVSFYYYMKIAKTMFLSESSDEEILVEDKNFCFVYKIFILLLVIPILLLLNFSIVDFLYNG